MTDLTFHPDKHDPSTEPSDRFARARNAAAAVAAEYAEAVDSEGRFPVEALQALKTHRLLSMAVPVAQGGGGATLAEVAGVCKALGSACASTAMVFAMHQAQLYCLVEHAPAHPWFEAFFTRLVEHQCLIASATSEAKVGGDLGSSVCCVAPDGAGGFSLIKDSPTISYGAYADSIVVTARRDPEAKATDQVLVLVERENLDLQPSSGWNTLGMRGTASGGFMLTGTGAMVQVLPHSFEKVAAQTMSPISHILWSSVWLGIATDAVRRAQKCYRKQARGAGDAIGQTGARLVDAVGNMRMMAATINDAITLRDTHYARHARRMAEGTQDATQTRDTESYGSAIQIKDLKVRMSTLALEIVHQALQVCGMAAYKNDSPFSLGRHLRDLHSAPIMINNDRVIATMSVLMLTERLA